MINPDGAAIPDTGKEFLNVMHKYAKVTILHICRYFKPYIFYRQKYCDDFGTNMSQNGVCLAYSIYVKYILNSLFLKIHLTE
jgi:hypothetical protein